MNKYRIVKRKFANGGVAYFVEKKWLWFWYDPYWNNEYGFNWRSRYEDAVELLDCFVYRDNSKRNKVISDEVMFEV